MIEHTSTLERDFPMKLVSLSRRLPAAVAVLLLSVGTALAAAPISHPANPASRPDAAETQEPTDSPETETPEPTDSPETEAPETESTNTNAPDNTTAAAGTGVSTQNLDRIVKLLGDAGITTTSADLKALADQVGVGGAVRVLEFANESGKAPADIVAMFKAGEGWGRIRKDLTLTGSSGIGRIMGGHGKDHTKHH